MASGASIGPTCKGGPIHFIDVNNDGAQDIFYLTDIDTLRIVEGSTGAILHEVNLPPSPHGTYAALPADFDDQPGQESIVFLGKMKKSNHGYPGNQSKLKSRATAITPTALISGGAISWSSDEIRSPAHGLVNIVDLDGDGRDEIIGPNIFNYQGDLLFQIPESIDSDFHFDSLSIADVIPSRPGFEVVGVEQVKGSKIWCFDENGVAWQSPPLGNRLDGDKVTVGEFDLSRPGLESWMRGNMDGDERSKYSWIIDSAGNKIAEYTLLDTKPGNWTNSNVERIWPIHWDGSGAQKLMLTERHTDGKIAIVNPPTGAFEEVFSVKAGKTYAADISGDWREEIIYTQLNDTGGILRNTTANPNPNASSLWTYDHYAKTRSTHNYYSAGASGVMLGSGGGSPSNTPPNITSLIATPDNVTMHTSQLRVTATDDDVDTLSYSWTATIAPSGAEPLVTFDKAGAYEFTVTVSDGRGGTDQSNVSVTVDQTPSELVISP